MTEEELKKEAKDWCKKKNLTPSNVGYFTADYCEQSYLAGAKPREKRIAELEQQIEEMKAELHHRLVSPSHGDSDCLDKITGLDRLWQFGQEF